MKSDNYCLKSKLVPCVAIVTVDEVGHGFVSPLDLNLDKSCFLAVAEFTGEHTFVFIALLLDKLSVPVGSIFPKPSLLSFIPFFLHFFRSKFSQITCY